MVNSKIKIKSSENINNIKVQAVITGESGKVKAGNDTGQYYSNLAKQWAIKTDGMVLNDDYSSKYYANLAKEAEINAADSATNAANSVAELDENYETYSSNLSSQTNNALSQIDEQAEEYLSLHSIKKEIHLYPEIEASEDGCYYWTIPHSLGTANITTSLVRVSDGALLWGFPYSVTETTVVYKFKAEIPVGTIKAVLVG